MPRWQKPQCRQWPIVAVSVCSSSATTSALICGGAGSISYFGKGSAPPAGVSGVTKRLMRLLADARNGDQADAGGEKDIVDGCNRLAGLAHQKSGDRRSETTEDRRRQVVSNGQGRGAQMRGQQLAPHGRPRPAEDR